jgi:hypothetical protein
MLAAVTLAVLAAVAAVGNAQAQANFDRPGSDYLSATGAAAPGASTTRTMPPAARCAG